MSEGRCPRLDDDEEARARGPIKEAVENLKNEHAEKI
jgi:hypothetical protein